MRCKCQSRRKRIRRRHIYTLCLLIAGGLVASLCGCDTPAPAYLLGKSPPEDGGPVLIIPFEFYQEFIFVKVSVNDKGPRSFLLDSGTSDHEISLRTAHELGLPLGWLRRSAEGTGEASAEESSTKGVSLSTANAKIYSGKAKVLNMAPLETAFRHSIDGVLGGPLFEAYVVQIDYTKHEIRLFDPRNYKLLGKKDIMPILVQGHLPYIQGTVFKADGSSITAKLLVDTGADAPLSLNYPFTLRNILLSTQATGTHKSTGIGGTSPDVYGHVPKLQISKSSFPNIPVFFSLAKKGVTASKKYDGSVGNYLLVHFLVTFDYPHKQIILQNPTSASPHH